MISRPGLAQVELKGCGIVSLLKRLAKIPVLRSPKCYMCSLILCGVNVRSNVDVGAEVAISASAQHQ